MFDKITEFVKEHKKEIIISGLVIIAGAVVYNINKTPKDTEKKKEKDYSNDPMIVTALGSQPQDWMLIISQKDKLGNDTDFTEVGRQIRNAEFEEKD